MKFFFMEPASNLANAEPINYSPISLISMRNLDNFDVASVRHALGTAFATALTLDANSHVKVNLLTSHPALVERPGKFLILLRPVSDVVARLW